MYKHTKGFSLIELVIVVVIIGILAAIAIPRLSRGTAGAADSALIADLTVMRNAIDLYATEHGGMLPTAANITDQLLLYSNSTGETNAAKGGAFIYGPYLREIPTMPVGVAHKGESGIAAASGDGIGWLYTEATGKITSNTAAETDAAGTLYTTY